jgi:hypothetical protein
MIIVVEPESHKLSIGETFLVPSQASHQTQQAPLGGGVLASTFSLLSRGLILASDLDWTPTRLYCRQGRYVLMFSHAHKLR